MSKSIKTPLQSLNKSYRRIPVVADDINEFIKHLSEFIENIDEKESEEYDLVAAEGSEVSNTSNGT